MTTVRPLAKVLRCLRHAVSAAEGPTDAELLELYRTEGDEAAFEMLLHKHATMVWSVCRRILRDVHDAEDAFQATFLVLVRKARSIRPAHMVGNWLHGVACRTAMNARNNRAKRKQSETRLSLPDRPKGEMDRALVQLLDEELERLPEKYRAVLVLCDLEGRTRKEAARQLGCPEGTVAGRLARARILLAKRLTRRGLAFSTVALAVELGRAGAAASAPLLAATKKTCALFALGTSAGGIPADIIALSKGVLKTMLLDKLKVTALVLTMVLTGLASTTVGLAPLRNVAAAEPEGEQTQAPRPQPESQHSSKPVANAQGNHDPALQGVWSLERIFRDGRTLPLKPGSIAIVITNRYLIWKEEDRDRAMTYRVRTDKNPRHIDLVSLESGQNQGTKILGIYEIAGDTLLIHESDGLRPRAMTAAGSGITMFIYKRVGGFGVAAGLHASSGTLLPLDASGSWANKLFEAKGRTSHDFGKVQRGKQVIHRFYLKNIYSVPIDITDTRVSCGCLSVTTVLKHLRPGAETHIDVQVDTRRFSGSRTFTIFLGLRGKQERECFDNARLQVSADSVEDTLAKAEPSHMRGKITNVLNQQEQLIEINIGSDDGLKQKQVLQIFRLGPQPAYLGEMRISTVEPRRAIGRVTTPSRLSIIVGDEVGNLSSVEPQFERAAPWRLRQVQLNVVVAEVEQSEARWLLSRWTERCESHSERDGHFLGAAERQSFMQELNKLRSKAMAKVVAMPVIETLSGRPATIVDGQQVLVKTGKGTSPFVFKTLGTSVELVPTILRRDQLRIQACIELTQPKDKNALDTGDRKRTELADLDTQTRQAVADIALGKSLVVGGLRKTSKEGDREVIVLITPELVNAD